MSQRALPAAWPCIVTVLAVSLTCAATAHAAPKLEVSASTLRIPSGPHFAASSAVTLATEHKNTHLSAEITLFNRGDAALALHGLALSPDSAGFSVAESSLKSALAEPLPPHAQRSIRVQYQPTPGRQQAYGALLIYSNDPRDTDDPRTAERDFVRSVPLCAGESTLALWLWLAPLATGLLAALLWSLRQRRAASIRWATAGLLLLSGALPLFLLSYATHAFVRGFGVAQGNYGYQFLLQRVLAQSLPLTYHAGLDGLSLILAWSLELWAALRVASLLRSLWLPSCITQPDDRAPTARCLFAHTLLHSMALALLVSLDLVPLLFSLLVLHTAMGGLLPIRPRRIFTTVAVPSFFVFVVGLCFLAAHSQPTLLSSGGFVEHTTDLVKLSYQNYFADLPLLSAAGTGLWGRPIAPALYGLLALATLAPAIGLAVLCLRSPLSAASAPTCLLPVSSLVGFYLLVRVVAGLLPQAHSVLLPSLSAFSLFACAAAAFSSALRRTVRLEQRLPALPLLVPLSGALVGLASATATGTLAALLLLGSLCLSCTWLGQRLARLPRRTSCTPQHGTAHAPKNAPDAAESPESEALRVALLLFYAPPGTATFVGHALLALSAFAALRGVSVLYVALWLVSQYFALLWLRDQPIADKPPPPARSLHAGRALILASAIACFCVLPLFELGHTWSLDFISHTRHASAPPGPGFLAHRGR